MFRFVYSIFGLFFTRISWTNSIGSCWICGKSPSANSKSVNSAIQLFSYSAISKLVWSSHRLSAGPAELPTHKQLPQWPTESSDLKRLKFNLRIETDSNHCNRWCNRTIQWIELLNEHGSLRAFRAISKQRVKQVLLWKNLFFVKSTCRFSRPN